MDPLGLVELNPVKIQTPCQVENVPNTPPQFIVIRNNYELKVLNPDEYCAVISLIKRPKILKPPDPNIKHNDEKHYRAHEIYLGRFIYSKLDSASTRGLHLDNLTYSEQYVYDRLPNWAHQLGLTLDRGNLNFEQVKLIMSSDELALLAGDECINYLVSIGKLLLNT